MKNSEIIKDILKSENQVLVLKKKTKEYFKENLDTSIKLSDIEKEETTLYMKNLQKNCECLNNLVHHFLQIKNDFEGIEKLANKISKMRKKCEKLAIKLNLEI